jgi:hypothetical protein
MIDIVLGVALIVLGSIIILYFNGLKKEHKSGLSIKLIGGGVGFIMIGLALIYRELF